MTMSGALTCLAATFQTNALANVQPSLLQLFRSACNATFQQRYHDTARQLHPPNPYKYVRGVLVDAAGTFLSCSESTSEVYKRYASKYGCCLTQQEIRSRYYRAYNSPWYHSPIRYVGDAKPFWRHVVAEATGCDCEEMFQHIYDYYGRPEAWKVAPGAVRALEELRSLGYKLAMVSNFDTRLRPLLRDMKVDHLFDHVVVSAEVGAEKPNPAIFHAALQGLSLRPQEVVHVGDDQRNDLSGARSAGIHAWLWGRDVRSFEEVVQRVVASESEDEELELMFC